LSVSFDFPWALLGLLLLPIIYYVGRFGVAYLARPIRSAAIAARLILTTILVFALAQPVLHRPSDLLSVMYVVDRSASTQVKGASAADGWLAEALGSASPRDRTGVVEFGANTVLRQPLGSSAAGTDLAPPDGGATNLAAALHQATSLFPEQGARRIVVLSDGQTNLGDAVAEARLDSTRDVKVDVMPIGPPAGFEEVLVDSLTVPPAVRVGQGFDVGVVVWSTTESDTTLQLDEDGKQISQGTVHLQTGSNRFSVTVPSPTKGFHTFDATIQSPHDTYAENNQAYAFTVVADAGKVAVVAANASDATSITSALQSAQIQVTAIAPSALPTNLNTLKPYDGMVIVNTPATAFSLDQSKAINAFAHDLGRGLLVIGGPNAYGQGKYDGTPLGDAMPVASGVPGNLQNGDVSLVLVIDKSGSMDENEGGVPKMAMADKAAQLAIGLLAPSDSVGVEAFDTDGTWVVPLQPVGNGTHTQAIQDLVGKISASGGTDVFTALQMAYNAIHSSNAQYKHIILMSDGNSLTDSNYGPLLQHIQDDKITLSTIAIGSDADKNLMQMLATKGSGSYYYTEDANQIPEITTRETRVVRGSAKVDAVFQPQIVAPSPILESFVGSNLPQLGGYVVTTARKDATVALQSDRRDPILAHWNYGLGRVAAWTSDLTPQWGKNWLSWSDFNRFWTQAMNWTLPPPGDPTLQFTYTPTGNLVDFRVDAVSDAGAFQDLLDLRARVVGQDGQLVEVPLVQTRPGRYEATFSIPKAGAYPVVVAEYDNTGKVVRTATTGVVVSYPAEYRSFGVNEQNLASVAAATGGAILTNPIDSFNRDNIEFLGQDSVPLWEYLLLLAVLLFPIDVAIRRLRVDPIDLAGRGLTRGRRWTRQTGQRLSDATAVLRRRLRRAVVG
jgi:Mg-chelatase subunit ChlD/uncharacterized membrane protein